MAQAVRTCLPQSSHPWTCAAFLECLLSITLYFLLYFFFLHFLMTDGDSVTINTLRNSANGTFVTLDDYFPTTQSTLRPASIWEKKGPSLGKRQVKSPLQRSPYAVNFEDLSHEETERQQRCARSKAWNLVKNMYKLKEKDQVTFYSPAEEWVLPVALTREPEER